MVPGDILFMRGGDIVPADCYWLEGDPCQVDEADEWCSDVKICQLPSGKHTKNYGKWPFIVDFPSYKMVIFYSYVNVYQRVSQDVPLHSEASGHHLMNERDFLLDIFRRSTSCFFFFFFRNQVLDVGICKKTVVKHLSMIFFGFWFYVLCDSPLLSLDL